MSNWKPFASNALETFNPVNDIEDPAAREEARRKMRFNMFKATLALQKQVVIKPKYIDAKVTA